MKLLKSTPVFPGPCSLNSVSSFVEQLRTRPQIHISKKNLIPSSSLVKIRRDCHKMTVSSLKILSVLINIPDFEKYSQHHPQYFVKSLPEGLV